MSDGFDSVVVGAGVAGLAVARALQRAGSATLLLEQAQAIGSGVSSRSSEVMHAGLYYPPGSLKAQWCVAGQRLLYDFCATHRVPYRRIGKLVVATSDAQVDALATLKRNAEANSVTGLAWLDPAAAQALEPALRCAAALHSPDTGIIDSHAYMQALLGDFTQAGGTLALAAPLETVDVLADGFRLSVGGAEPCQLHARRLVNAAGLAAQQVASRIDAMPSACIPALKPLKGSYFSLRGKAPFARLIYPLPEPGGLGIHLTLDLGGQARFGPDTETLDATAPFDYRVDPARAARFAASIRRFWPDLPDGALLPAYAGIRPQFARRDGVPQDFILQTPRDHGIANLVNLFGIESPGLTASLALAEAVRDALG